jgi:hypothetical protein
MEVNIMLATLSQSPSPTCASPDKSLCDRIARIAEEGPEAVNHRLAELDAEWTVGRWVKVICGTLLLAGLVLALTVDPWWLLLVGVGGLILTQYLFFRGSVLGWLLTSAGVRPGAVIEDERTALRVLRGDFKGLPTLGQVRSEDDAVSRMVDEGGPAHEDDDDKLPSKEVAVLIATGTTTTRGE